MAAATEQLDWKLGNFRRSWKWHKRQMSRLMRRMAKRNPEDAPKVKPTNGWYS